MKAGKSSILVLLSCFLLLFANQFAFGEKVKSKGKKFYRIEDEKGEALYTDQIPPEKNRYQQEILNSMARPVQVKEKEKSPEQQALEYRLAVLRKEEEKLIARQKLHDEALLSTYHSNVEIAAALEKKMRVFSDQRKALETTLANAEEELKNQLKIAANYERDGQQAPGLTINNIKSSQQQIEQLKLAIQNNIEKQQMVKTEFNADIERYLFLTQTSKPTREDTLMPSVKEANSLGLFYCDNDHQCNKAWQIARDFINLYSTTPPNIFNEKLIMNRPPMKDNDISLSLSRIAVTDNDYLLFLDILCQTTAPGRELCASDMVKQIRLAFRPYINNALTGTGKQ